LNPGYIFALSACFIWGLIFIIPQFMDGFTAMEVALGRNLFYGLISALIFCKSKVQGTCRYPRIVWQTALRFSLISTIGYYTCVVLALRYSSPAICVLILGISPIAISLYGNWKEKETSYKNLIIPSLLLLVGLGLINIPYLETTTSISSYILGIACCLFSLTAWSWYVVANLRFLQRHPEVRSSDWSTLMGVSTLFWVMLFALFIIVFFSPAISLDQYATPNPALLKFLSGSAVLGMLCSWVGAFLWNKACLFLPVSLAGQLTIFETIFGVVFVYIVEQRLPPLLETLGLLILLGSVVWGIATLQASVKRTLPRQCP